MYVIVRTYNVYHTYLEHPRRSRSNLKTSIFECSYSQHDFLALEMLLRNPEAGEGRKLADVLGNLVCAVDDVDEKRADGGGVDDIKEVSHILPGGHLEQRLEGSCGGSGLLEVGSRGGRHSHRLEGR